MKRLSLPEPDLDPAKSHLRGMEGWKGSSGAPFVGPYPVESRTKRCNLETMARRVFFSFHYQRDIFRANIVRNSGVVEGSAAAGFQDASLWEEAKKKSDAAVEALIDKGLVGTTVTAVLIGAETANRKFVGYEIRQSLAQGNGLLGIYIDGIPTPQQKFDIRGAVPRALSEARAQVYTWDRTKFGEWVEAAYQASRK